MAESDTCTIDGCNRPRDARQMCATHYARWKRGAPLDDPIRGETPANTGECSIPDCTRDAKSMGMCYGHYQRYKKGLRGAALNAPVQARVPKTGNCTVEGCDYPINRSGLCEAHYNRKRKGLSVDDYEPRRWGVWGEGCSVEGCEKPHHTNGYCGMHWQRVLRHGDPNKLIRGALSTEERFWQSVDTSAGGDECWPWTKLISANGYGRFSLTHSKSVPAHRYAYEVHNGVDVPKELQIEHTCHTEARKRGECAGGNTCEHRKCCNPAHLTVVDVKEQHRLRSDSQTHCKRGHEFTEENTYIYKNMRRCRACRRKSRDESQ